MEFEAVIGLEVHVQLLTESKVFGTAATKFGAKPNANIDPVSLGLPGSLPVLNKKTVDFAIMLGLATHCEINGTNRFARKHYFYPDLPKGYQISQFEEPICERGSVDIVVGELHRAIGIKRIHIEEDAGKSTHYANGNFSLVDCNRAGVGLVEIVSEPDIRSAAEAAAYLRKIRQLVRWLGICDGNMEEGSLRCDANVSLRPLGELKFGTRTEIKNLNSFKFIEKAIEYEIARQIKVLRSDEEVIQTTMLYDSENDVTRPMRGKEEALDYRYFPDPDLMPLKIEESWIETIRQGMPTLPDALANQLVVNLGLSEEEAQIITSERDYFEYFQELHAACQNPKLACSWMTSELFGKLNKTNVSFTESPVKAKRLGRLLQLIVQDTISGKTAKAVFEQMWTTNQDPEKIIAEKGLQQISDRSVILNWVLQVIKEHPKQIEQYRAGSDKVFSFFVGQVMKLARGNASPSLVNELLLEELQKEK